jgi:hypothetical protein
MGMSPPVEDSYGFTGKLRLFESPVQEFQCRENAADDADRKVNNCGDKNWERQGFTPSALPGVSHGFSFGSCFLFGGGRLPLLFSFIEAKS